jgi:glycosyltransferase involved in cell wall biosynthesis
MIQAALGSRQTPPSPRPQEGLSVFLPAFNEVQNIRQVLSQVVAALGAAVRNLEIIVVDDGSLDGTSEIVRKFARDRGCEIRLVCHPVNRGYGAALRTGFRACRSPWIFFMDADGQFDIQEIHDLIPLAGEYDIIAGYRLNRQDSRSRRFNAAVYGSAVRLLLGLNIKDVDCAFKLIRREVVESVALQSTGAAISAELLAKAVRAGYRFTQVGVHHYPRVNGEQTGARFKVILRAIFEILSLSYPCLIARAVGSGSRPPLWRGGRGTDV